MKLSFSTVLVAAPGGEVLTYWESGHPDEYDIWELMRAIVKRRSCWKNRWRSGSPTISMKRRVPGRMHMRSRAILICWTPITSWPAGTGAPGLSTGRMSARYEHSAFTWNYDGGIGRSRKCTLSHTQRHGRDFIRSSSIWARRAAGVPDC